MRTREQLPITALRRTDMAAPAAVGRRRHLPVAFSVAVVCVLMAGCDSTWWPHSGASSCGLPAWVRVGGRAMGVGDCAGSFLIPARKVTLTVGQPIGVHMTQEPAGTSW